MTDSADNNAKAKESVAKKIWLAGLGAYGQGFDEAVEQYTKVNDKTSQLFGELVKKGTELEEQTRTKIEKVKTSSTGNIDQRLNSVRQKLRLGGHEQPDEARLKRLEEKLDALTDAVAALTAAKTTKKTRKTDE